MIWAPRFEHKKISWPAILALVVCMAACHAPRTTLTLSVAASLQESITEVEAIYQHQHPDIDFRNNFGSSGTLAREIEQGAPADALLSAGAKQVDELQAKGLLIPGTRQDVLRNQLVLIAPQGSSIHGFDDLAGSAVRLVALGDPASVPAGQYGEQTLQSLHLYDKLKAKIVLGKDVRQVLTYVETGNADAGLVYATDAQVSRRVQVVAVAADASHAPIVYPLAMVKGSQNQAATQQFLRFLTSPEAQQVFRKHGFTMATS